MEKVVWLLKIWGYPCYVLECKFESLKVEIIERGVGNSKLVHVLVIV